MLHLYIISQSVELLSHVQLFATPSPAPGTCSNSCPSSRWCHPTISSSVTCFAFCPQSFQASGSFSNESALRIRWPRYWSFSFSIRTSNEYSGLISFRIDLFYRDNQVKMRSLGCSLIQYHDSPFKKKFGHRHAQREDGMKTQREDGCLRDTERGLEQIHPSWRSPRSWALSFHNYEKTNFRPLSPTFCVTLCHHCLAAQAI